MTKIAPTHPEKIRHRLRVTGVVQGVGFRPHVYTMAVGMGLSGFVGNDDAGVFVEIEGAPATVGAFALALRDNPPPLALIDRITEEVCPLQADAGFAIIASQHSTGNTTLIAPDVGLCDECLRELYDPMNRRYRYPFINCTHCGPRFTIIQQLPYDRPLTTMADFTLCPSCQHEYDDPTNRRFHAQPNACPDCGPYLIWQPAGTAQPVAIRDDALRQARAIIQRGGIIAVKGLGGYHLVCDATNESAVTTLRQRKQRPAKPFAVMVRDSAQAYALVTMTDAEEHALTSQQRPIVLLHKRPDTGLHLAKNIAPDVAWLGIFLPYTPLHYLLLDDMPPLVMTSANISGEPIISHDADVIVKLGAIADGFLMHNRAIHSHCDDSVLRLATSQVMPIRRSRGYAPYPVRLPDAIDAVPALAVGAEMKNTFCLIRGHDAFMSQYIGEMGTLATQTTFEHAVEHLRDIFRIVPERIITDAHPDYASTRIGQRLAQAWGIPVVAIQHHHAHIASVMAENHIPPQEQVLGICWDGTGYGADGAIWGGEILLADYASYERLAHLAYAPLVGGDHAVKSPYRIALAQLWAHNIAWDTTIPSVAHASDEALRILSRQLERQLNSIPTSSMGRLFDAVASLLGIVHESLYEAHPAMALESIAQPTSAPYAFRIETHQRPYILNPEPVLRSILADQRAHIPPAIIAGRFQASLVNLVLDIASLMRDEHGVKRVALSGGVFQNQYLQVQARQRLIEAGFDVLTHHSVPANDGGLALGQAVIGGLL